jgi:hypothetical protein
MSRKARPRKKIDLVRETSADETLDVDPGTWHELTGELRQTFDTIMAGCTVMTQEAAAVDAAEYDDDGSRLLDVGPGGAMYDELDDDLGDDDIDDDELEDDELEDDELDDEDEDEDELSDFFSEDLLSEEGDEDDDSDEEEDEDASALSEPLLPERSSSRLRRFVP